MKTVDHTGKPYGRWRVKELVVSVDAKGKSRRKYRCVCECGTVKVQAIMNLVNGRSTCCRKCCATSVVGPGNPAWRGHGEISSHFWTQIKRNAATRGIEFLLTIEDAWQIFEAQQRRCALSGLPLTMRFGRHGRDASASLDRVDSREVYCSSNVQWVHKEINLMKGVLSQDRFLYLCRQIARTQGIKDEPS